jgi:hypothetical protein
LYNGVKALRMDHKIMLTTLPANTFTYDPVKYPWAKSVSEVAHAHTATKLTSASVLPAIYTKGIPTPELQPGVIHILKMNIYQWAKSNPKGSRYQPPTNAYTGVINDDPAPVEPKPKVLRWINHSANWNKQGDTVAQLVYSDGSTQIIKSGEGNRILGTTISVYNQDMLVNYLNGADQTIKLDLIP